MRTITGVGKGILLFVLLCLLHDPAWAGESAGRVLVLPLKVEKGVTNAYTAPIDALLLKRMQKAGPFKVHGLVDLKKEKGNEASAKLKEAERDGAKIAKILSDYGLAYDLLVFGTARIVGKKNLVIRFEVYRPASKAVKRKRTFNVKIGEFREKPHAKKWAKSLLGRPHELDAGFAAPEKSLPDSPFKKKKERSVQGATPPSDKAFQREKGQARASARIVVVSPKRTADFTPEEYDAVYEVVVSELNDYDGYDVFSQSDLAAMLGAEEQKQLLGCDDESCYVDLSKVMKSELLGSVSLAKIGRNITLTMKIIRTGDAKVLGRDYEKTAKGIDGVFYKIPGLVHKVVKKMEKARGK